MKKIILFAFFVSLFMAPCYAWEISVDDTLGGAVYKEEDSSAGFDLDSDWKAFYNKTTLYLADYDNKNIEGEARFGFAATAAGEETWDINTSEYQTNDMSFWGTELGFALGWAFQGVVMDDVDMTFTPLLGYKWKFIRFTRSNFNILNIITIRETIDEDFNVHSIDFGFKLNGEFRKKFELYIKPIFGLAFYNSAYNSVLGTVEGDGGYLLDIDVGMNYVFTEHFSLGAMFRTEFQWLEGGSEGNIIWPDNTLEIFGGTIKATYKF